MIRKGTFPILLLTWLLLACMVLLEGCKHEPAVAPIGSGGTTPGTTSGSTTGGTSGGNNSCNPNTVYFERDVLPILISNCAKSGCHDAATAEEGIVLDSYNSVINSDVVRPHRPGHSDLYKRITEHDPDKIMPRPPAIPLSQAQIALIGNWIAQGAQNLSCTSTICDTASVTYSGSIRPLIENKCKGCHSGPTPAGGHDFSTHAGLQAATQFNLLLNVINHASGFPAMPRGGAKLPDCDIAKITKWVRAGAPNN